MFLQEEQWQELFDTETVSTQNTTSYVHLPQQGQQDPADREQHRHQWGGRAQTNLNA